MEASQDLVRHIKGRRAFLSDHFTVTLEFEAFQTVRQPMRSFYDFATFRSLRHRNFRLLVEGNVISTSGDFMQSIAQSWLVWQLKPTLLTIASRSEEVATQRDEITMCTFLVDIGGMRHPFLATRLFIS